MKIAILTFHKAYNCGAMLQAWALKTILERMGHTVEFPSCNTVGVVNSFLPFIKQTALKQRVRSLIYRLLYNLFVLPGGKLAEARYKKFKKKYLSERNLQTQDFTAHYDVAIIGSDQVWSKALCGDDYPLFSGEILLNSVKKISYAASYGDRSLTDEERAILSQTLPTFSTISVREKAAQKELTELTGREIALTLDPTLLLTAEDYQSIAYKRPPKVPYLYVYWVSGDNHLLPIAQKLAQALHVKLIVTPVYIHSYFKAPKGVTLGVSPDRMVAYNAHATYVLAASFHGTVFGLLNKKPFLSYMPQRKGGTSRVESLLHQLGLEQRVVTPETPLEEMLQQLQTPIPEDVYTEKLPALREQSIDWLKTALGK